LSAVNSHARSASAVRARTTSVVVRGLGWVAAINAGVAIRSRRTFWIPAVVMGHERARQVCDGEVRE